MYHHGVLLINIVRFQLRWAKSEVSDTNTANTGGNINHPPLNTGPCVRLQVMADFVFIARSWWILAAQKAREMKAI